MERMDANVARKLILAGELPDGVAVEGHLDFNHCHDLTALPAGLTVKRLTLDGCQSLAALPERLNCYELSAKSLRIKTVPPDLRVEYRLDLSSCTALETLPEGLKVGSLVLRDCVALRQLPEGLDVYFLDISNCTQITALPERASVGIGKLNARGCTSLRQLPAWLTHLSQLDVSGCVDMQSLPEGLRVSSWLDLANTQITALPESLRGVRLRWRDVLVNERVVFAPETLTADEIINERNAELRRVMMERKGYEAFMQEANAEVLDQDRDPGGERRLLRLVIPNDEALAYLAVRCPSTERQYLLRVPPATASCHQAAAWIAGFDNPDEYQPLAET